MSVCKERSVRRCSDWRRISQCGQTQSRVRECENSLLSVLLSFLCCDGCLGREGERE